VTATVSAAAAEVFVDDSVSSATDDEFYSVSLTGKETSAFNRAMAMDEEELRRLRAIEADLQKEYMVFRRVLFCRFQVFLIPIY
jgi:hypothetical protein